jgi:hypothetical protein
VRPLVAVLVVAALVSAGCAGAKSGVHAAAATTAGVRDVAASTGGGTESAGAAAPGSSAGAIHGTVTTDELIPLENATVALSDLHVDVRTSPDGRYEFRNVPIGAHTVAADRAGYGGRERRVEVKPDQGVGADFQLVALVVQEPFVQLLNHVAIHHVSSGYVDFGTVYYANATFETQCEKCRWLFNVGARPDAMLIEIFGAKTVKNPAAKDSEFIYLYGNNSVETADFIYYGTEYMPSKRGFTGGNVTRYTQFNLMLLCDLTWICFEEKRDVWVSVFHDAEIPVGYSARPA